MPALVESTAPAGDELHALLQTIACRLMEMPGHAQERYGTVLRSGNAVPAGGRAGRPCRRRSSAAAVAPDPPLRSRAITALPRPDQRTSRR
jgi:hypothetical protein